MDIETGFGFEETIFPETNRQRNRTETGLGKTNTP